MKKILLIVALFYTQAIYAQINDGIYAYMQGDYELAYNTMISLATTSEDKVAQYYIGIMYLKGQGVEKDEAQAADWLRKASEQGLPNAMYKLANLYASGKGVPQDNEFAYVWYSIGAAYQHGKSMQAVADAKANLSEEELAAAESLINEYMQNLTPPADNNATAQ